MQLPFPSFMPASTWQPPALSDLPDLSQAKEIAYDLETYDPHLIERGPGGIRKDGFITGYALAVDGFKCYLPIRHSEGNLPAEPVQRWVRDQLSRPDQPKLTANGGYEREWSKTDGIQINGVVYDVQIAECLLNEEQESYSLDAIAFRHLKEHKDETLLIQTERAMGLGHKKAMHLLGAGVVGLYAEGDADRTLRIWQVQKKLLEAQGLMPIFQMESELSEVFFLMRQRGVRINEEATVTLAKNYREKENAIYRNLQAQFFKGRTVDFNSGKDLASVCEALGYSDYPRTEVGNPSFIGDWMDLQGESPLGELFKGISEFRTLEKIRRDYLEGHFAQTYKGRIHAQFHQTHRDEGGTRSGRISVSNPPMQGVPSRSHFAKDVRSLFLPEEGQEWVKGDYSQQEYRIFVHYAMLMNLDGAKEAGKVYQDNAHADFHQGIADMTGLSRTDAKNWNFAAIYGAGLAKTALMTKKSLQEAERINNRYHEKVPYAKALAKDASSRADQRGWIKTIGGRVLHFDTYEPAYNSENKFRYRPLPFEQASSKWPNVRLKRGQTHKALNRLVQGSAADMSKVALLTMYKRYGIVPMMVVHDDANVSGGLEQAKQMKECMESAIKLLVPVIADFSIGKSWGEQIKVAL